ANGTGKQAFVWNGSLVGLPGLGGTFGIAARTLLSGDVIGDAFDASNQHHFVRWHNGLPIDLGPALGGQPTTNGLGQIVASGILLDGGLVALSSRVPSNFTVYDTYGINDAGQILARVFNSSSHVYSAAVLTPYDDIFVDTVLDETDAVPGDGVCRSSS